MAAQSPVEVRSSLVSALQLDLIGPTGSLGDPQERLSQMPSRWYLTGFLVPTDAEANQAEDPTSADDLDQAAEPVEIDEATGGDKPATRVTRLSSSMGLSVLLDPATTAIDVEVRYGEYTYLPKSETNEQACWARQPRAATVRFSLGNRTPNHGTSEVPDSGGVESLRFVLLHQRNGLSSAVIPSSRFSRLLVLVTPRSVLSDGRRKRENFIDGLRGPGDRLTLKAESNGERPPAFPISVLASVRRFARWRRFALPNGDSTSATVAHNLRERPVED